MDADDPKDFRICPRPAERRSLRLPLDVWTQIDQLAASLDMSANALIRFYIGQGLRNKDRPG